MSTCDEVRPLLGGYVLGALDAERTAVESHLASCPVCRREVEGLRDLPGLLDEIGPHGRTPESPPGGLEEAVLDRFVRERGRGRHTRRASLTGLKLGLALGVGVLLLLSTGLILSGTLSGEGDGDDEGYGTVRMAGPRASARADLRELPEGTGIRLSVKRLPAARERVYEVWCVPAKGRWISGGTFRADAHGNASVYLTTAARPGDYERIVVTRTAEGVEARASRRVLSGLVRR